MTRHRRRIVCNTPRWNQIEQVGGAGGWGDKLFRGINRPSTNIGPSCTNNISCVRIKPH